MKHITISDWFMLKTKQYKSRSGYVSIETIFAMTFFLLVFLLVIGFFTFVHPYSTLNRDVHALATLAQRQGGLTLEDVDNFQGRVESYPFVDTSKGEIDVSAYTIPGDMDAIGVDSLDEAGEYYVTRDSKEFIEMVVTIPSYNELLTPVANFFGSKGAIDRYVFKETFMSERY